VFIFELSFLETAFCVGRTKIRLHHWIKDETRKANCETNVGWLFLYTEVLLSCGKMYAFGGAPCWNGMGALSLWRFQWHSGSYVFIWWHTWGSTRYLGGSVCALTSIWKPLLQTTWEICCQMVPPLKGSDSRKGTRHVPWEPCLSRKLWPSVLQLSPHFEPVIKPTSIKNAFGPHKHTICYLF